PTRHYLLQVIKSRVASNATWPGARTRSPFVRHNASPPPRREARDELKPAAAFCIAASRPQLRHPRAAPVGDLDPDDTVPGPDGHRDRLSWSTRPAMPDAVAEQLPVHQQRGVIPARVPEAEHRAPK